MSEWLANKNEKCKRFLLVARFKKEEPTIEEQRKAVSELYLKLHERLENRGNTISDCKLLELSVAVDADRQNPLNTQPSIMLRAILESAHGSYSNVIREEITV